MSKEGGSSSTFLGGRGNTVRGAYVGIVEREEVKCMEVSLLLTLPSRGLRRNWDCLSRQGSRDPTPRMD